MNKREMKKKTIRRSFDFEPVLYHALMDEAHKNARSFPAHVTRVLEEHVERVEK